jgi:flagellar protein FliO/FliZ
VPFSRSTRSLAAAAAACIAVLAPASALAAAPTAADARPSAKVAPKRHHAAQPRRGRTLPPVSDHGEGLPLDLGSSKAPKTAGPSAGGGSIVRTLLGLGVVIALIYGVAWVMRQLKEGREGRVRGAGLASVSAVPLGANRSVHLVRAGRDYLLLGVAEQGVVHLRSYGEDEARAAGLLDAPEPPARGGGDGPVRAVRLSPQALLRDLRDRTVRR